MLRRWSDALAVYADRRLLVIALLGFSSGLPLALTFSTLSFWLKEEGPTNTTIGLFASVSTPYALKFLRFRPRETGPRGGDITRFSEPERGPVSRSLFAPGSARS